MIALKRILVATDFSEAADTALRYGRALARNFGAKLVLLHVTEDVASRLFAGEGYGAVLPEVQASVEAVARTQLDERLAALLGRAGATVSVAWQPGGHELTPADVKGAAQWLTAQSLAVRP